VTALIKSVTRIDSALFPGDFPLDVMLHPATVQGVEGLAAMRILLKTYMAKHGIAIHFNVFDADTLIEAQKHPDKYQGLQIRVCGWNVNFTELCRAEQDMYIRRARNIAE
jgi:formate C-acetyltransferase